MKLLLALSVLLMTVVVAACGGAEPASEAESVPSTASESSSTAHAEPEQPGSEAVSFPLEITDAAGKTHRFEQPVTKVGCDWFGCFEILADMGIIPHAGAVSPDDENMFWFPNGPVSVNLPQSTPEEWAKAEVDVILTRIPESPDSEALEMAAPVFYLHHPSYGQSSATGIEAYKEDMRLVGQIMGKPELAQAAIDRYDQFVAALKAKAPPEAANLKVGALLGTADGTYMILDPENPFCDVLAANGLGTCIAAAARDSGTWQINAEAFLAEDPDWIVYGTTSPPTDQDSWKARTDPVWGKLRAVEAGQVFDTSNRHYCCSLRGLMHVMQDYGHYVFGPETGIPPAGPLGEFDPRKSPLLMSGSAT